MNKIVRFPLTATCASLLLSTALVTSNVQAADADKPNPLQFYTNENGSSAKLTLEADLNFFSQSNAWFGNSATVLGKKSDSWWESLLRPGIDASYVLPSTQSLYGQLNAVQANTFGGIDAGGTNVNYGDVQDFRIDHAFAGWRSGNLFSALDKDFLDISFGRQSYTLGDAFLFSTEGAAGFNRGAYWIGGRKTADYAGIVRMKSGAWSSDLIYLAADDIAKTDTKLGGGNVNYSVEKTANIGAGFYTVSSDTASRDSMRLVNLRGGINPFTVAKGPAILQPLRFDAEYVHEDADTSFHNGNAWSLTTSYPFENAPWKPTLSYRYASFDEHYDPLFYGSSDWGNWYQGEILGEYALLNANLDSHMLRLKMQPIDPVTVNLFYYKFLLHDAAAAGVTSDKFADEYNLVVDWAVNDHLTLSAVGGIATPGEAAIQKTGGDKDWSYMMLGAVVKF
jgi:hypothetical protein